MNKKNIFFVCAFTLIVLAIFILLESDDVRADTDWPEGPISKDTVWTQKDSPYNVDGLVTVEKNVKLTVEPGVAVRFNSQNDINYADYGIVVQGEMDASGAAFTRHPDNSYDVAWAGITFEESKKTSDVNLCIIEYADSGVHTLKGSSLDFTDSVITWGKKGIYVEESFGLDLIGHEISHVQQGIYIVDSNDITVKDSTVNDCFDVGILVDLRTSQSYDINILNCEVKANAVTGIELRSVYDSEISNCDISENIVTNVLLNSKGKFTYTHDVLLSNNFIKSYESTWYFTSNGIEIYGGSDIEVLQCTILDNNMFGMYVSDCEVTVSECEIAYSTHHYGLFSWNTQLTLRNNHFHDNSYSVWAAGGSAVFSSHNTFKSDFTGVTVYHSRLYMEFDTLIKIQHGVYAMEDCTARLFDCDLKGSEISGIGIRLFNAESLHMTECTISSFFYGVQAGNTPETFIKDNVFLHNRNVAIAVGTNFMDISVHIESNLVNQGGGGIFIGGGLREIHCRGEIIKDNIFNNVEYGIWVNLCEIPIENNQVNHASTYGIHLKVFSSPLIKENTVRNSNIGIFVEWWSDPEIRENTVKNCLWGIYVTFYSEPTIIDNEITIGEVGIACDVLSYIVVRENFIRGFRQYGIIVYYAHADISDNVVRDCREGIYFYYSTGSVTGNLITHTDFGVTVHSSKVSVKGNTFRKNKTDIRYLP
ncbi:MAG: right-handed parallel beta-helix repeat-containing protein [Thermoplasmata archaeon]|nr:MAG: right-handed parallel beta-helix repeat-containing protein [Thermoplasmata archaeon]